MEHDRVNITGLPISCGVAGLNRINEDTDGVLYAIATRLYHPSRGEPFAFFIASDIIGSTATSRLMDEVAARKFGTITKSPTEDNPKTGNTILIYVWTIQHESFKKWYADERSKRIKKVGT